MALDCETGKEKWKLKVKNGVGAPAVMNDTVYFSNFEGNLYAADA